MSILSSAANFHVPIEFVLFGLSLLGIAVFHRHTLGVSLAGPAAISLAFGGSIFPLALVIGSYPEPKQRPRHGPPRGE